MSVFDFEKVRRDFPILDTEARGKPLIYLDNAATSQKPRAVIDAISNYYKSMNANAHRGIHYLSELVTARYEEVRAQVAGFIHAQSAEEIVFVRGTTEAINLVAQGWGDRHIQMGDTILATRMEHHANFVPWQELARRKTANFKIVELTHDCRIDLDHYRKLLETHKPKLVCLTLMSNVLGTINPVRKMAEMAHAVGAKVLVDAAQAIAHFPIDLTRLGPVDFLAFSGHKVFAPTGIGVLYIRSSLFEEMNPYQYGGNMIASVGDETTTYAEGPGRYEAGTSNIEGVIGLGAAIGYLDKIDFSAASEYEHALGGYLVESLSKIEGLEILGPKNNDARGAVASFTLADVNAQDLAQFLDMEGIAIRTGHMCAQPLLRKAGLHAVSRASLSFYNTRREIDALVEAIEKTKTYFKRARVQS